MIKSQDAELQLYRDLIAVPDRAVSGFGLKTLVGAVFLGFIIVPGSIYLSLFIGTGILSVASRWVTIILFAEVAKRAMASMKQQELFVLFYMTGIALGAKLQGAVMTQLLFTQYLSNSDVLASFGIDPPSWYAASAESIEANGRTFFTREWMVPLMMFTGMIILQRLDGFGIGYALFRLTSHGEKLPFPMAPVSAAGISALADDKGPQQRWRWRCFAIGGVLGLAYGALYIGVPAITGSFFGHWVQIIPVPWLDLTPDLSTKDHFPATPLNLVFDLQHVITGMVLPFWAVVGGFAGLVITVILNPILYREGVLTTWEPKMNLIRTQYSNQVDFYLSFGIGLALAIFVMSLIPVFVSLLRHKRMQETPPDDPGATPGGWREVVRINKMRGDLSVFVALGIYTATAIAYICLASFLVNGFPWKFFLGIAFIYQPIMAYVNAKLEGMVGQTVQIPMVREASFIFSGYQGSDIWFAPIPINEYATATRQFREMELLGTRPSSLIKTELVVVPIVIVCIVLFSQLIWKMQEVPSEAFPFARYAWELSALQLGLIATSTAEGSSPFMEAIKFDTIGWGMGLGLVAFAVLSFLSMPTLLIYGVVRGLGETTPGGLFFEMAGAILGRIYLQKKFGHKQYKLYMAVILAGYGAGMGLIGMACVALAMIANSMAGTGY